MSGRVRAYTSHGKPRRLDTPKQGAVYFVQGQVSLLIKIGFTANPKRRMAIMRSNSPEPLKFLGGIVGDENLELAIHRKFHIHRQHGEWFRPDKDLIDFIACAKADEEAALFDWNIRWKTVQ